MFKITKTSEQGDIYPDEKYLANYQYSDIGALVYSLAIDAISGKNIREIGDSKIYVSIKPINLKDIADTDQLKEYVSDFVAIIKEALPTMSIPYANFYNYFLNDYKQSWIVIPRYSEPKSLQINSNSNQ